ncbi:MAG TPA: hypothetical protein VHB98_21410 [Chloroflexota bacterium]|nr:hypothetical protein [Chloroflexota bacterium]
MYIQSHPSFHRPGLAFLPLLGMILLLLVLGAMMLAQVTSRMRGGPIYTVAALRAHLAQDPAAWMDRPLRVRAIAAICRAWLSLAHASPCVNWQLALTDPGADDGAEALPLASGPVPPLVELLRRLPLIRIVAPAPQQPRWDAIAVYRIQLHALACGPAQQPPCYEALLLDAAPSLPDEE